MISRKDRDTGNHTTGTPGLQSSRHTWRYLHDRVDILPHTFQCASATGLVAPSSIRRDLQSVLLKGSHLRHKIQAIKWRQFVDAKLRSVSCLLQRLPLKYTVGLHFVLFYPPAEFSLFQGRNSYTSSTSHFWQKDVDVRNQQGHTLHDNSNRSLEVRTSDKPQCGP